MTRNPDQDFAALERAGWADASVARSYARDFAKAAAQCVPELVSQARIAPGAEVLDLCCGHGIVAQALVAARAQVTALDFSPAMLALARSSVAGVTFVQGDAMAPPFQDGRFSAVTCGFGIPHVPDPALVLTQARRVLRTGGRLSYSVWQGEGAASALTYVFQAIAAHGDPAIQLPPGPGTHDYSLPDIALPALDAAGFGEVEMNIVASRWEITDPGAPFDFIRDGTVRGSALLQSQPAQNATAIRQAVVEKVLSAHGRTGPWIVPIPAVIVCATAV